MEILQLFVTAKFITKCEGQADNPFLQSVTRLKLLQIATSITITNRRPGITKCDGFIKNYHR